MSESLKATTVRNVGYNSLAKIIQMAVMAAANVILTRTLAPSDYGIVGFAIIFTAFLNQFSDLGIGSAVIQKKELSERELYTAYTIKFVVGLLIFLLACLGAPLAVRFFDNPAIVNVIRVLAFNFVLNTFWFLPNILMSRSLNFRKISTASTASAILNSLAAVTLALLGFGYWSLVIAAVVLSVSTAVFMNLFQPVRYRFAYDREAAHRFIRFGGNLFLSGLTVFLIFNADNFLIGSVKGAAELGYYGLAFNWGSMICTLISSILSGIMLPTYAKLQGDRERLRNSYLKVLQYVSFGGVLINMTLFVVSRDFLFLVLGQSTDKWFPALTAFRILCCYGMARLLLEPVGSVMTAIGCTSVVRNATLLVVTIELVGLYPVLHYFGIEGVALLVTAAYLSQYFVYYRALKAELSLTFRDLRPIVAPVVVGSSSLLLLFQIAGFGQPFTALHMICNIIFSIILYICFYGLVDRFKICKDLYAMAK